MTICFLITNEYFNPRLREGGDNMTICFLITNEYFNPRLREGGDSLHKLKKMMCRISIRASAKEATRENGRAEIFRNFNPRLREGGDADCSNSLASSSISIHASVKEATSFLSRKMYGRHYFNPRLREGGDTKKLTYGAEEAPFQSTPP